MNLHLEMEGQCEIFLFFPGLSTTHRGLTLVKILNLHWLLMKRKNLCPKMADRASSRVPVPVPGLFWVLLPALLPACAKSAKYAKVEVYKLPRFLVLGAQTFGGHSPLSPPVLN